MNDPNLIRNILQQQRQSKVRQIEDLQKRMHTTEDEINTIDQLLQLTPEELEKFANVISQVNAMQTSGVDRPNYQSHSVSQPVTQPKSALETIQGQQRNQQNQNTNQDLNNQQKKGLGSIMKKKDKNDKNGKTSEEIMNAYLNDDNNYKNYYENDDNNW